MRPASAALAVAAVLMSAGPAAAHAFGARYDLPLPLGFYLGAAGLAVVASFLGAVAFLRTGHAGRVTFDMPIPPRIAAAVHRALIIVGLATITVVLATAFLGPAQAMRNFATITVWVLWWVGFLLLSGLAVELWPGVDPFRGAYRLICQFAGRNPEVGAFVLPRQAGWLAPAGLLAIAWVELVSDWSEDPRALGIMILLYLAFSLTAGAAFGLRWFREADPLGRLFELVGRIAPVSAPRPAALELRLPGEGLLKDAGRHPGEVMLVVCLIGTVLFDGLSETPAWAAVLDSVSRSVNLRGILLWLRDAGVDLLKLIQTLGLISTIAAFLGLFLALAWGMRRAARTSLSTAEVAAAFASTLMPIAIAYHLSHYVSYLLIAGQLIVPAVSDPLGSGWNLFGTARDTIDVGVIGAKQVWWIAVVTLVAGHTLSVLISHRRALAIFGDTRRAATSQLPMAAAMVGLTACSLWILSQPITE